MTIFLGEDMECLNFTSLLIETKQLSRVIVYFLSTPRLSDNPMARVPTHHDACPEPGSSASCL